MLDGVDDLRTIAERAQKIRLNEVAGEHGFGRQHGHDDAEPRRQAETVGGDAMSGTGVLTQEV